MPTVSILLQPGQRQGEDTHIQPGRLGPAAALTDDRLSLLRSTSRGRSFTSCRASLTSSAQDRTQPATRPSRTASRRPKQPSWSCWRRLRPAEVRPSPRCCLVRTNVGRQAHLLNPADVDQALLDRLNNINITLTTQWNRLQNIRNTVDDTSSQAGRAQSRVHEAKSLIERAQRELDKARDAISKVVSPGTAVVETVQR